jgi:diacylglycerol kinase (ATP)
MAGIGIVNNPRARRNLRSPGTARRLRALLDGEGEVADASTREELDRVVSRFRACDIDVLGVNGGDGTGHVVLTAFASAYGAKKLPAVVLLRSGAMNTVADSHRLRGSPESILRAFLEKRRARAPCRAVERDLLAVEADGGRALHGFLFGTGAVVAFLDAYYRSGHPSPATAAALLVRAVGSALVGGRFATGLAAREPLRVTVDGEEWPDDHFLSVMAGSVPEIGFGFAPFARCDEQPGFFHAVGITGSVLQIATRLLHIWLGRPWRRALALDAVTRDLRLESAAPVRFTVDGDLYEVQESLRIRSGPPVRLLLP